MGSSVFLSSPVLVKTGAGENETKEKNTPCLSLLFLFPTSPAGCQLPAFLSLHPLLSAVYSCQRCAEMKDWGITVRILGKMCKKLNLDGQSIPSTCGILTYSVSEENDESILVCSQRSFKLLLQGILLFNIKILGVSHLPNETFRMMKTGVAS